MPTKMHVPNRRSYLPRSRSFILAIVPISIVSSTFAAQPPVTSIAFSPDGQTVAVGSQAGLELRSWPTLALEKSLDTQLTNINDLAFSHDGKQLAASGGIPGEDGTVEIFPLSDGSWLKRMSVHDDLVFSVAWQKDDAVLATASLDGSCKLIDAKTGKITQTITGHSRAVTSVCFLPVPSMLVTAGMDHSVRVWNTASAGAVRMLSNHTKPVHDLAVRPRDESTLPMIASVSDDRTVRLWQPTIGRMVRFVRFKSIPLAVTWLPDGSQIVVCCQDGRVRLIDPDTVEVTSDLAAVDGWAYCVAVHPKDKAVLVGGRHGQLKPVTFGIK